MQCLLRPLFLFLLKLKLKLRLWLRPLPRPQLRLGINRASESWNGWRKPSLRSEGSVPLSIAPCFYHSPLFFVGSGPQLGIPGSNRIVIIITTCSKSWECYKSWWIDGWKFISESIHDPNPGFCSALIEWLNPQSCSISELFLYKKKHLLACLFWATYHRRRSGHYYNSILLVFVSYSVEIAHVII